jgi:phospholipase/carboxylesterase
MVHPPLQYISVPFRGPNNAPAPVLIFLHGRGSDEQDLISLTPSIDPRFQVVSVRAPYQYPFGGNTWFEMEEPLQIEFNQVIQSARAFFSTLDEIQARFHIDSKKVFLFGFSMGAMMAMLIALLQPARFKGIVAHSGLLLQDKLLQYTTTSLADLHLFIAHGIHDPIVPVHMGRKAQQWFSQTAIQLTYQEYPIQHTISDESLHDICRWLHDLI